MAADRNDALAAHDTRGHDRRQTDAADAEDRDRVAEAGLEDVDDGAEAGQEAAAQRPEQAQIDVGIHHGDLALIGDGVGGEGGLAEEHAQIGAVFLVKTGRAVRQLAEEVQREPGVAARGVTADAVIALAAVLVGQNDVVAGLDAVDHGADLFHDAGALMAQHAGDRPRRHLVASAQVRVAAAARDDLDKYLVCLRLVQLDLLERELALFIGDSSFD